MNDQQYREWIERNCETWENDYRDFTAVWLLLALMGVGLAAVVALMMVAAR